MTVADWIVGGVILAVVLCAVRYMWKQRKNGQCTGNCAGCHGCCHGQEQEQNRTRREEV